MHPLINPFTLPTVGRNDGYSTLFVHHIQSTHVYMYAHTVLLLVELIQNDTEAVRLFAHLDPTTVMGATFEGSVAAFLGLHEEDC